MTRTIVKTGAVLIANPKTFSIYDSHLPKLAKRTHSDAYIIHGDLHVVGDSVIMYMPLEQADVWPTIHGVISFACTFFYRRTEPFSTLVLPKEHVLLNRFAVGELIWADWCRTTGTPSHGT